MPVALIYLVVLELVLGLLTTLGANWVAQTPSRLNVAPDQIWLYIALMLIVVLGGFVMVWRRTITSRAFWELFFGASSFMGVWFVSLILLPKQAANIVAAFICAAPFFIRKPITKVLFFLVGLSGLAWILATKLSSEGIIVLGCGLTVYDLVFAKPGEKLKWPDTFVKRDLIPGLPIPNTWRDLFRSNHEVTALPWLGIAELLVPMTLLARIAFTNLPLAILLLASGLGGMLVGSKGRTDKATSWFALCIFIPGLIFRAFGLFV